MLTINTKTKRFTLKGDEEQSERLFGLLVSELLNLAGGIPETRENKEPREDYKPMKDHSEREMSIHTRGSYISAALNAGQRRDSALKRACTASTAIIAAVMKSSKSH